LLAESAYSTFRLDTKSGAKRSRQNELLRSFCHATHKLLSFMATPYFLFSNFISDRDLTLPKKLVACDAAFGSDTLEALYFSLAVLITKVF
jgi:hypothetical protein